MSKIKMIEELLVGAFIDVVPDGSNIGTVEAPSLTSKTAKPATDEVWSDYNIGRTNSAKYDPKFKETPREWANQNGGYSQRTNKRVVEDALLATLIDFNELYHRMMFGLAAEIEDDTPQPAFGSGVRHIDAWVRLTRKREDGTILCQLEMHAQVEIAEHSEDKSEHGSPKLRIMHLKDADPAIEPVVFNPAAA